ncbi:MAG: AsmA-like C-terminal domain-containing protein [Desulforhopalus sp.]
MKKEDQSSIGSLRPTSKSPRRRLLAGTLALFLLVVTALAITQRLVDVDSIKEKIQTVVTEQTGGSIDYQNIELSFFPRPTVKFRQVSLSIPDRLQGTVAALHITPKLFPLLSGTMTPARIELQTPRLSLEFPDTKSTKTPAEPFTFTSLEKSLTIVLSSFGEVTSDLAVWISNGQFTINRTRQKILEIEGLSLQLGISVTDSSSAILKLQALFSELSISRNGLQERVKDISLRSSAEIQRGMMTVTLDRLALAEPGLELKGGLTLGVAPTAPDITLHLSGSNIDVDATRKTVLGLAGDITLVRDIFDYLRGGRVPQISFRSHGEDPSELGNLDNILIEGQLQAGKISIPQIALDLNEVTGDLVISGGVLEGSRLSTRLGESVGQNGSLKLGLAKDSDIFLLELTLAANLAETQPILQRIINAPTFIAELEKTSNLRGVAHGRLILGDRLSDISTRVEIDKLTLSADYKGLPWPITITQGQLSFFKDTLDLDKFSGTLGGSQFANLSCQFLMQEDLSLAIRSGQLSLVMSEFYPWLTSLEELREPLNEVRGVTGLLTLSAFELKGEINKPSEWIFASKGSVQDLSIDTEYFPAPMKLVRGGFTIDSRQLAFEKVQAAGQDTTLSLAGNLKGFPRELRQIDISLSGKLGPKSVRWLSDTLKVQDTYAIHAPLSISNAQISWQPASAVSFNGSASIENGPAITADIDYLPENLQIHKLTIKDQYSNAAMSYDLKKDQRHFEFTGKLQHQTMKTLFIDPQFSNVRLEGSLAVTVPQKAQSKVTTKGLLTGENLPVFLSSGDTINIDKAILRADGSLLNVDIERLTWKGLIWQPLKGTVSFDYGRTDIRLAEAQLCGIDSPGMLSIIGDIVSLDMNIVGKGLDVATSYTCLTEGLVKATGSLDFSSHITAEGQTDDLLNNLRGPLTMTFSNGMIEQDKFVSRTLEVLNVTEIVKGRLPNLSSNGFAYTTTNLQGEFKDGKLIIHNFYMDGETLDLVGNGEILLKEETVDAQLLAAPFKTVDTVVKNIPGVNYILGGTLVTIPIGITGPLADPKVVVMSASAVGSSLFKLAERTIKSPFKLIETLIPWGKSDDE